MEVKSIPDKTKLFELIDRAGVGRFTNFKKTFLRFFRDFVVDEATNPYGGAELQDSLPRPLRFTRNKGGPDLINRLLTGEPLKLRKSRFLSHFPRSLRLCVLKPLAKEFFAKPTTFLSHIYPHYNRFLMHHPAKLFRYFVRYT